MNDYEVEQDADRLLQRLMLTEERRGAQRLLRFTGHRWMYDGESLRKAITAAGFRDAAILPAGSTTIHRPGALNLREREEESVYVEAKR